MQYKDIKKIIDNQLADFTIEKSQNLDNLKNEINDLSDALKEASSERLKKVVQKELDLVKKRYNNCKWSKPIIDFNDTVNIAWVEAKKEYKQFVKILKDLDVEKNPISLEISEMLNSLSLCFRDQEKTIQKTTEKLLKNIKKDFKNISFSSGYSVKDLVRATTLKNMYIQATSFLVQPSQSISSNSNYPFANQREKCAKSCTIVVRNLFRDMAKDFDNGETLPILLSDAATHYNLAIALLNGNKKEIDKAYSMDTACRDLMTNATHAFINEKVFSSSYPNPPVQKKPMKLK